MRNTRVSGHSLVAEGAAFVVTELQTVTRARTDGLGGTGGYGRGYCSCGALSDDMLTSGYQRKAWHRDHKAQAAASMSQMHPADWKRLDPAGRARATIDGSLDGIDWRVTRVADLTGLSRDALERHVEDYRGWETHDQGYLHAVVESARQLLARTAATDDAPGGDA